jgi:type VI secretion system secreted protein Hcp
MAENMHLKLGDIAGEDETAGYEGQIVVLGWNFGATQSATMHVSKGGGAAAVSVRDVKVVKYVDKASPNLFKICASGEHIATAELSCQKAAGAEQLQFFEITMERLRQDIQLVAEGVVQTREELTRTTIDHSEKIERAVIETQAMITMP